MSRPWDVVVVGAGIVGAAVARASAQAGLRTLLVEQEARGGQGTTGAATGHLVTLGETPAQLTLTRFALECWRRESARLPPSVHYLRRGTLWVAETPTKAERARRQAAELRAHAVEARWVPGEELRTLEPVLRPGLEGGLLVPGDGGVDPVAVTDHLLKEFGALGGTLRSECRVSFRKEKGLVDEAGTPLPSDRIVLATGHGTSGLLPGCPVRPRKGTLISVRLPSGPPRHQVLELGYQSGTVPGAPDSITFNLHPRADGSVVVGSSRQWEPQDLSVDPDVVAAIFRRAETFVPGLRDAPRDRSWSGLRPSTPDLLPLLGVWPPDPRVLLATGHEGLGITTAFATGEILGALLTGKAPPVPLGPFLPARFLPEARGPDVTRNP